jgi:hypothetical protein
MFQRKIHGLSRLPEARHFLIRALAWATQPQHGIAALGQRE